MLRHAANLTTAAAEDVLVRIAEHVPPEVTLGTPRYITTIPNGDLGVIIDHPTAWAWLLSSTGATMVTDRGVYVEYSLGEEVARDTL